MGRIWKVLTRKKAIDPVTAEETRLNRVLNTFDLTALGVGSTLGVGVYVLAGQVAKDTAGPSVVLSFLIAAIASVFAGLCYAEFGARAPKAGSAYIYSYVCVGEFIAFVIGWNLILEYVIGSASVAKGLSLYVDTLINNTLQDTFREIAPINVAYLSPYFDFFSFGVSLLLSVALAFGLKESTMVNNIVTGLNIMVVLFVIIAGSIKADPANWSLPPNNTNSAIVVGNGGFFPFGVEGMIKGAATCFYGFIGFDCIATTGEEVKNPRKAIPVSIIVSLFIIFLAYFGTSTVLTLMVPYYLQDHNAPIPRAFETIGWNWAKWIVAIGAIFGLCASLFGAMFPLPRIIYAMGSDGLVFKFLAKVSPRFQTPVIGTLLAGVLTGFMSSLFDLRELVNMMSIGTLLAYTIVAASVMLLRYKEEVKRVYIPIKTSSDTESISSESSVEDRYNDDGIRQNFDGPSTSDEQELIGNDSVTCSRSLQHIFNFVAKDPNRITETIVAVEVFLYCILCVFIGLCAIYLKTNIVNGEIWAIAVTSAVVGLTVILIMSLMTQPTSKKELPFKVPFVPLIPALSILVNIYLMLMLDVRTWIRFAVWMAIGVPMYCMRACVQKPPQKQQNGTQYAINIVNGHAKMSNGISNPSFVQTEIVVKEKPVKKKAIAPPPPIVDQKENIEVQQQAVIAQLDEILDNEVAIAQLDDVLDDETCRIRNRKLSAGSLSDMSAVVSRFEDVVADVHCASTPTANPKCFPFPFDCDNSNTSYNAKSESGNDLKENSDVLENTDENVGESKVTAESDEVVQTVGYPTYPGDNEIACEKKMNSLQNKEVNFDDRLTKEVSFTKEAIPHGLVNESTTSKISSIEQNIPNAEYSSISKEIISPSDDVSTSKELNSPKILSFAESANKQKEDPLYVSHVPTKEALKSVTLRRVRKEIKHIENNDNLNASEDNLKVGSEEYKSFIKSLDNKLKRSTAIPSMYYVPNKNIVVKPTKVEPNENVLEESINHEDAKEKLKLFIESSLKGESDQVVESKLGSTRIPLREQDRSKSVDDSLLERRYSDVLKREDSASKLKDIPLDINVKNQEPVVENNDIGLETVETMDDKLVKRKLSNSLGSSFSHDKNKHRQKMDDIFKTIKKIDQD